MKNTEFIPADFDAHGRLRLPLLFWCVLLLQARTWVLFLMAGASRQQGDAILNLFYPDHERFLQSLTGLGIDATFENWDGVHDFPYFNEALRRTIERFSL